jgi:MFS family permease
VKLRDLVQEKYVGRFYFARFVSNVGNGMAPVALAFAVLDLPNGNATLLGTILGINTVALLIMFPFGGVIADRYGRAKWIAYGDVLTALLLFFQVSFFATGNVPFWVFVVVNVGCGLLLGIWWPAFNGVLPALLPERALQKANALNNMFSNTALIIGAALGGILVSTVGSTTALAVDAATFLVAGLVVYTFKHVTPPMEIVENTMLHDLKEGWRVFTSFRWLVVIDICFAFIVMSWAAGENVLGPLVAREKFDGAKSWSMVLTAVSIGLIVGSFVAMRFHPKYPMLTMMCLTVFLAIYIWTIAKPQPLWIIIIAAFLWGVVFDLWKTIWDTALQTRIPREALSRVAAYDGVIVMLFRPVGLALAGPFADKFGVERTLNGAAILVVLAILFSLLFPEVRKFERLQQDR